MSELGDLSCVRYTKLGHIAHIELNRPSSLNAMNLRMHEELAGIWDDFESDPAIWLGVLSGAGDRAFSVGQDLKELDQLNRQGQAASSFGSRGRAGWPRLTERFELSKPLVAKVRGYALGGGFELALACDIVIAAEDAEFGLPEARLGLIPGAGGVFRLARQIPVKAAMGYLLSGRRLSAARAYELGLVNEVVPAAELDACVGRWLDELLQCAPLSQRAIKQVVAQSATLPLAEAFERSYSWESARRLSEDCAEGPRAFAEKRQPIWKAQ
ncbi:enoyl-CoA-hydratase DpgD [Paucibacter sp. APW11]|uniref:Enoyl-CoA-hydratase DpgD n=1 Tax=Roseateles aquae TaxID=3077235 RepID=A0ABU3PHS8_9BURK|nr:enoyl-CoA-hydratase DpgD [Paucibacter sp. APW11]MDT9002108.1 enoyl-CoA-hydratase DpgD [Paucibacter sp. APW11]